MKISVAMATYNGAQYLEAQLASFADQTLLPDEVVVTDDCSDDRTQSIIDHFARTAPFSVVYKQNKINLGYAGNFNEALTLTTGDLVFLSDQDDVWYPEKIERIAKVAADKTYAWVLMNDAALTDGGLQATGVTKLGQIRSAGFDDSAFVMGCCAAVRRELLELCLPIPHDFPSHDNWVVQIAELMGRKVIVPEVLQYYRRHGSNESKWIANRTTRVTRWHVELFNWLHYGKRLFQSASEKERAKEQVDSSLLQHRAFSEWVKAALERSPGKGVNDLQRCASELEKLREPLERRSAVAKKRDEVRNQFFADRLISVIELYTKGEYRQFSGAKSALRDLLVR